MTLDRVLWDDGEAAPARSAVDPPVHTVPIPPDGVAGKPESFCLLAEPKRVWVHWVYSQLASRKRTMPHTEGGCEWCPSRKHRLAYAAALRWVPLAQDRFQKGEPSGTVQRVVLYLTPDCWTQLAVDCCRDFGPTVPWRGMKLDVWRVGSKMIARPTGHYSGSCMTDAFDVAPILERVWGGLRGQFITTAQDDEPELQVIPFKQKGA